MSTKTTFKRIALVAVASLGFGMISIAPSQAVTGDFTSIVANSSGGTALAATATQVAGANNFVSAALEVVAGTPYSISVTGGTASSATAGVTGSGTASLFVNTSGTSVALLVPTPTVGTITVSVFGYTNGSLNTTATSRLTITVIAAAPGTTLVQSTAFMSTTTNAAATADTAAPTAAAAASATPAGRITVTQYSTTDTATVVSTTNTRAVVVSIAGAGSVSTASNGTLSGPTATVAAGGSTNGVSDFYVYPNGVSGVGTVTISVNGTVVSTKTITFFGVLASYSVVASKTHIGVGETGTLTISGRDALGNAATLGTVNATSGTTTVATVTATDTSGVITVTGVAPGSSVITLANATTSPTITTTVTVNVARITAQSVALSFDKEEYTPGERMTVTVTALDSNGAGVADGSRNLFSAAGITSNVALQGATWTASAAVTVVAGKATFTAFAPLVPGPVVISATQGTALNNVIALASSATSVTASTRVVGDGAAQAAADAAAEATDAANAATDAANAAAEAADAATAAAQDAADAVAALSTQVTELVTALRKQITALTNLVIKIQRKVRA